MMCVRSRTQPHNHTVTPTHTPQVPQTNSHIIQTTTRKRMAPPSPETFCESKCQHSVRQQVGYFVLEVDMR